MKTAFIFFLCVFFSVVQSENQSGLSLDTKKAIQASMDKGIRFLRNSLNKDGHLGDPALTALALSAFFASPRNYGPEDGPWIRKGVEYLVQCQKSDGGIYVDQLRNYYTSVAVLALTAHPQVATQYKDVIEKAKQFLLKLQCDEEEGYTPEQDKFYGGFGYGSSERPDLSNTQYALEALKAAGLSDSDPAFQKAVVFLQRCQNRSESNDQEWAGNDGGFIYYPGSSVSEEKTAEGKTQYRSYGSMTYSGIKSYIYANLSQEDPRFKAAMKWIQQNYDLSQNPGAGQQGLYYYYHTFAKTLALMNLPYLKDDQGAEHNWREDLAQALVSKQKADGSWKNENPRWWEADPRLVTAYSILCLASCLK
ncbi:MAG: terpene cyclase/mutase family protein [Candidatus Brocadiae bacterium]|nr:terpene cyclase/mutase family protein [Candidatus Brocadiia bacterium]